MNRTILAICADLHGGHYHGLMNPETTLEEQDKIGNKIRDYHPKMNPIQDYLWETYTADIDLVREIAGQDPVIAILAGDMTAGIRHPDMLVSNRMADQVAIAKANMKPWHERLPTLAGVRFVKGTGAHNFGDGSSEILLSMFEEEKYPAIPVTITDHELITVGGMTADISHHGPTPGSRNWLKGNEARYYLRSLMMDELMAGQAPPRLVVRGHYHTWCRETLSIDFNGVEYTSTLVILPSYTFPNGFARQMIRSPARVTHGMMAAEAVDGGLLRIYPLRHTIDIRTKEIIHGSTRGVLAADL